MGKRQRILEQVIYQKYPRFVHERLDMSALENSGMLPVVNQVYKLLGGQFDAPPLNIGSWDISTTGFLIELDEERHFNRYRKQTLSSSFYSECNLFDVSTYSQYCLSHEQDCLRAAKWGRNWSNVSTEKMFLRSSINGNLEGNGSSRWRQRAYYDFIKDISASIKRIPLIRISIYDRFLGRSVNEILSNKDLYHISNYIDELFAKRLL